MTASCNGGHPKDPHGNQLFCSWCPELLDKANKRNELGRKLHEAGEEIKKLRRAAAEIAMSPAFLEPGTNPPILTVSVAKVNMDALRVCLGWEPRPAPLQGGEALQAVGYAPGSYVCRCHRCQVVFDGDKRAVTCEGCAKEMVGQSPAQKGGPA